MINIWHIIYSLSGIPCDKLYNIKRENIPYSSMRLCLYILLDAIISRYNNSWLFDWYQFAYISLTNGCCRKSLFCCDIILLKILWSRIWTSGIFVIKHLLKLYKQIEIDQITNSYCIVYTRHNLTPYGFTIQCHSIIFLKPFEATNGPLLVLQRKTICKTHLWLSLFHMNKVFCFVLFSKGLRKHNYTVSFP